MYINEIEKRVPLRIEVYEMIKEAIVTGELEPGERIIESKLAEEVGISRTPIREAIRLLESEGYITCISNGGVKVSEITEEDIRDWSEIKMVLDELAMKKAIENITSEQLKEMEELLDEMKKLLKDGDKNKGKIVDSGTEFHQKIFEASGNKMILAISKDYQKFTLRLRNIIVKEKSRREEAWQEHKMIFEAIKNKNSQRAIELIRNHSHSVSGELLNKF